MALPRPGFVVALVAALTLVGVSLAFTSASRARAQRAAASAARADAARAPAPERDLHPLAQVRSRSDAAP